MPEHEDRRPLSSLSGLRVLDLTSLFAAPQIGAALADFGADVVKIEPRAGDPLRRIGVEREGASVGWSLVARNKRAITLDLEQPRGRALLARLVDEADVLIENATPEILERWECDYARLSERNPALVVVSVSAYGRSGPYADRAGAGTLAEAFSGFAHMNGEADGPPLVPSLPLGDTLVGFSGVIGTLLALYARDRVEGGIRRGQHVDVSMFEPVLQLLALPLAAFDGTGESPRRMGSRVAGGVPRNLYRARDGRWLALSGTTDSQVARILSLLGRDSDADQDRFARSKDRLTHADALDDLVEAWIADRDRADALAAFESIRIPVAPVNDLAALLDDPHVRARASIESVVDPAIGTVNFVAPSPRLSATPGRHVSAGPALGTHNVEVFGEWLGLSEEEVGDLADAEIV